MQKHSLHFDSAATMQLAYVDMFGVRISSLWSTFGSSFQYFLSCGIGKELELLCSFGLGMHPLIPPLVKTLILCFGPWLGDKSSDVAPVQGYNLHYGLGRRAHSPMWRVVGECGWSGDKMFECGLGPGINPLMWPLAWS